MKALVGAFNQEKALVGAFSVIVQPVVEPMDRFTPLVTSVVAAVRDVGGDDPGQREPAVRLRHRPHHDQVRSLLGQVMNDPDFAVSLDLDSVDGLCPLFVFTNFLFSIFLDHLS